MSGTPTKPISAANVLNSTSYAAAKSSSLIRALFEEGATMRAVHGNEVLDFSLGNPTLPPPKEFVEILAQIAQKPPPDLHSYMMNIGRPNTRAALAKEFSKWHDIDLRAENLIITCGAAAAINVLFNCIISGGDEIIIIAPFFAEYLGYIRTAQGKAVIVKSKDDFDLDMGAIESAITDKTKAIIINTPNNPSGKAYSSESLKRLGDLLINVYNRRLIESNVKTVEQEQKTNESSISPIFVVSDEPYRRIWYLKEKAPSILPLYPYSFIASSFSKDLSLPGERIGFLIISSSILTSELIGALSTANRVLGFVNAPSMMQFAVEKAITCNIDKSVEWYKERRDLLYKGIIEI